MGDSVADALQSGPDEAHQLNLHYWHRHGATLLGLMRHHGVKPAHFLALRRTP
jgi:putative hydrolase of the HAD superfamily